MKKSSFLNLLTLCLLVSPVMSSFARGTNWEDRPLGKSAQNTEIVESAKNKHAQKSGSKKGLSAKAYEMAKKTVDWCKKPGVKYLAGALVTTAVGAYAMVQSMRGTDVAELPKDNIDQSQAITHSEASFFGTKDESGTGEALLEEDHKKDDNNSSQDVSLSDDKSAKIDDQDKGNSPLLGAGAVLLMVTGTAMIVAGYFGKSLW